MATIKEAAQLFNVKSIHVEHGFLKVIPIEDIYSQVEELKATLDIISSLTATLDEVATPQEATSENGSVINNSESTVVSNIFNATSESVLSTVSGGNYVSSVTDSFQSARSVAQGGSEASHAESGSYNVSNVTDSLQSAVNVAESSDTCRTESGSYNISSVTDSLQSAVSVAQGSDTCHTESGSYNVSSVTDSVQSARSVAQGGSEISHTESGSYNVSSVTDSVQSARSVAESSEVSHVESGSYNVSSVTDSLQSARSVAEGSEISHTESGSYNVSSVTDSLQSARSVVEGSEISYTESGSYNVSSVSDSLQSAVNVAESSDTCRTESGSYNVSSVTDSVQSARSVAESSEVSHVESGSYNVSSVSDSLQSARSVAEGSGKQENCGYRNSDRDMRQMLFSEKLLFSEKTLFSDTLSDFASVENTLSSTPIAAMVPLVCGSSYSIDGGTNALQKSEGVCRPLYYYNSIVGNSAINERSGYDSVLGKGSAESFKTVFGSTQYMDIKSLHSTLENRDGGAMIGQDYIMKMPMQSEGIMLNERTEPTIKAEEKIYNVARNTVVEDGLQKERSYIQNSNTYGERGGAYSNMSSKTLKVTEADTKNSNEVSKNVEIKVDLGGVTNNISNEVDVQNVMDKLCQSIETAVSISAEGVHI